MVRIPDKGTVLAAQRLGHPEDFTGPLRLVRMKGDKVKIGKKIKQGKEGTLPKKVDWLLTFTSGRFTSPDLQEFLVMSEYGGKGKLRLLDAKGDVQWKSSDKFGGSDNFLDRPDVHVDEKGGATKEARRIYLPPRMIARDLDGDGMDEVVAVINEFSTGEHIERLRFYSKGYVSGLTWDGMGLAQAWRTQDISGYVADFQLKDVDNDGRDELVTASVSPYFFKKEARGTLAVYELYE